MGLAALALVALVASGVLLGDGGSDAEESAPRSASELASESTPLPPQGLEAATARAIALIDRRFTAAVDSSRVAHGLASAPPESWLTGYYLANATQFPDVRAYWQSYGALLEGLRVLDRALVADVIENELDPSIVLAADRSRVAAHLEERYASALPRRQELYTQLSAAAASAIALHDFLVSAGDEIRYTPALGGEVIPRDPVLEVGAEDPAVRARLEANLDAIFEALDRSRGGGAPAQANLEEDLFGRFATF